MRIHLKNIAQVGLVIVFCAILGETGVRALYGLLRNYNMEMWRYAADLKKPLDRKDLPFHHYPNRGGAYYGVEIRTNSMGFRDREYAGRKPEDKVRIVVLGDSFTLGWGVPPESVYSDRLETTLNGIDDRYEVINMGIGNYNTVMEVELFKWKGLPLDPDIVILAYFLNDTERVPARKSGLTYSLVKYSYLGSFLFDRITRLRSRFVGGYRWESYYANLYTESNSGPLAAQERAFQELAGLCKDRGIELVVANIPELREIDNYAFDYATEYIRNLAEEAGVPFIDLMVGLRGHQPGSLWVSPEDSHSNGKANGIIAEQLYSGLVQEGLL